MQRKVVIGEVHQSEWDIGGAQIIYMREIMEKLVREHAVGYRHSSANEVRDAISQDVFIDWRSDIDAFEASALGVMYGGLVGVALRGHDRNIWLVAGLGGLLYIGSRLMRCVRRVSWWCTNTAVPLSGQTCLILLDKSMSSGELHIARLILNEMRARDVQPWDVSVSWEGGKAPMWFEGI
jgi:hypothetical protein